MPGTVLGMATRRYSSYEDQQELWPEHDGFRFYGDEKTKMVVMVDEEGRDIYIVNPLEVPLTEHRQFGRVLGDKPYILWFGTVGATRLFIWARSLEDALEEAGETLAEHFPGLIEEEGSDQMKELYEEAREELGEDADEGEVWEQATADMTYTESGYITSYEWGIDSDPEGNEWPQAVAAGAYVSKELYKQEYPDEFEEEEDDEELTENPKREFWDFVARERDLSKLTRAQHQQIIAQLARLPLKELRHRQDLTDAQIRKANDKRDDLALKNLQIRRQHLDAAIDKREFGS